MNRLNTLAGLLLAAAVAAPAISLAQDRDDHRDDHRSEQRHDDHDRNRGAGPEHNWHKGDRIPDSYRDKRYEVTDWRAHHLSAPPAGYHWVNVNGDFVLAAVATGVIADLLLNN
jgi:Ni/Co efflux regulator RcnB